MSKKTNEYNKKWRERNPWSKHRSYAKNRHKLLGYGFDVSVEQVKEVWFRDKAWLLKQPSIDRIDSKNGYYINNIRFIERKENSRLGQIGKIITEKQRTACRNNLRKWLDQNKNRKVSQETRLKISKSLIGKRYAMRPYCKNGHSKILENIYARKDKNGFIVRACRICRKNGKIRFEAKNKMNLSSPSCAIIK